MMSSSLGLLKNCALHYSSKENCSTDPNLFTKSVCHPSEVFEEPQKKSGFNMLNAHADGV